MIRLHITLMALIAVGLSTSCESLPPERPEWVPASSVYVPAPKRGYWHFCQIDEMEECRCTVYLHDGRIVYDEVFLPYEGPRPSRSDLIISPDNGYVGVVKLANGQRLLPLSKYKMIKESLDWSPKNEQSP